jgi:hypothetical protein
MTTISIIGSGNMATAIGTRAGDKYNTSPAVTGSRPHGCGPDITT